MPKYIEAESLLKTAKKLSKGVFSTPLIIAAIENAPTADVVEVVRCKDCRRATEDIMLDGFYDCVKDDLIHSADHFCSHGRRKEGAN